LEIPVTIQVSQFAQAGAKPTRSAKTHGIEPAALDGAVSASTGTYDMPNTDAPSSFLATGIADVPTFERQSVRPNASDPNRSVMAAGVSPSLVVITVSSKQGGARGPGVIYDTNGHILTNHYIVDGAGTGSKLLVTLNDKWTCNATFLGADPSMELAVIKLTDMPSDLKTIALSDANVSDSQCDIAESDLGWPPSGTRWLRRVASRSAAPSFARPSR
jgi:putative serine protease PepD